MSVKGKKIRRIAKQYSNKLIKKATEAELVLLSECKRLGIIVQFQRSTPKSTYKHGFFIPDFTFKLKHSKLFVEIDGGYHNTPEQQAKDELRTKKLVGYYRNTVIRFTNEEVLTELDRVIGTILSYNPRRIEAR